MAKRGIPLGYARTMRPQISPRTVAPFFILVALINAGAVASRFDLVAQKLPGGAAVAVMLAVFPLLLLGGYFEGRIDYDETLATLPLWMRIKSVPVKLAFTFGFMYLTCVALQTWDVSIGPVDPSPPETFPPAQRAMWFGIFTAGMFFPFYLAATSILIPVLRVVTKPLRALPPLLGALLALVIGGGLGVLVLSAVTSSRVGDFVRGVKTAITSDPTVAVPIAIGTTVVPLLLGLVLDRED